MTDVKYPVYIPAGSNPSNHDDPLLMKAGVTNKAMIEIGGRKIIEYVLEAVDHSKFVDEIFIVGITGQDIDYQPSHSVSFIPSVGSRMDTLHNLLDFMEEKYHGSLPSRIMSFSADIPLLKADIIDTIIQQLQDEYGSHYDDIQLFYPLIPKDLVLEEYPWANKRFRKFTEGKFATGDFMIFDPGVLRNPEVEEFTSKVMTNRKQIVKLLLKFDIFAPIKYLLGRLSARDDIFPFIEEYLGVKVDLMIADYPEICLDLDYPEDLEKFESYFNPS